MTSKEHGEKLREKLLYWLNQGVAPKIAKEIMRITNGQYAYHVKMLKAEGKIKKDFRFTKKS